MTGPGIGVDPPASYEEGVGALENNTCYLLAKCSLLSGKHALKRRAKEMQSPI